MEEQFCNEVDAQSLAYQLVDITPQELHDDDKETDAEGHQESG
jgi:hypothetical protein